MPRRFAIIGGRSCPDYKAVTRLVAEAGSMQPPDVCRAIDDSKRAWPYELIKYRGALNLFVCSELTTGN